MSSSWSTFIQIRICFLELENTEASVAATREIGLEVSADKTKYMVMSRGQNAGRIQSVRLLHTRESNATGCVI